MHQLFGGGTELVWVAIKAFLLYLTAVFGFRIEGRRTLAEMSPFDFVAAVAVGAIVGRVPNTDTTSYLAGAVTLVTVLLLHWIITRARFIPSFAQVVNPSPRILVASGRVFESELWRCGLTDEDLLALLRQHGIADPREAQYVVFEPSGQISVMPRKGGNTHSSKET